MLGGRRGRENRMDSRSRVRAEWVQCIGVSRGREVEEVEREAEGSRFMRKEKQENTDDEVLQDEFREFLRGVRENVELYLWFALSALIERNADRKFEAKTYPAPGMVSSTF
jgi:hypothetical protein